MKKLHFLALTGLLAFTGFAQAQDYIVLDRTADDYDRVVVEPEGTARVYETISRETLIPVPTLREQQASSRLGYGGLFIANSIAAETGRPFAEIVALRQSGRGWGQIAQQYNVNLGGIVSRTQRADSFFRSDNKLRHDEKKAAKFVNGHDARDGKWDGTGPGRRHGHTKERKATKGNGHGRGHGKDKDERDDEGHGNGHGKGKGHGKH